MNRLSCISGNTSSTAEEILTTTVYVGVPALSHALIIIVEFVTSQNKKDIR